MSLSRIVAEAETFIEDIKQTQYDAPDVFTIPDKAYKKLIQNKPGKPIAQLDVQNNRILVPTSHLEDADFIQSIIHECAHHYHYVQEQHIHDGPHPIDSPLYVIDEGEALRLEYLYDSPHNKVTKKFAAAPLDEDMLRRNMERAEKKPITDYDLRANLGVVYLSRLRKREGESLVDYSFPAHANKETLISIEDLVTSFQERLR